MASLRFWCRWLLVWSVSMALLGCAWMFFGSFEPTGRYDAMAARTLLDADSIPESARPLYRFAVGLLGATTAAYFVMFAFVVRYPFARRERWAHAALSAGLLTWFVLDTGFCVAVGAWFNVVWVNIPCLLVLGVPLAVTARQFYGSPTGLPT